ncbi:MAG: T9SS type A sorting domain-containing protein, partial [Bacteroidota bacterium]
SITLSGNAGSNSQWIVTDDQGNILGLPPMPSVVNFDGAGPGTCLVWHLSYDGEITGLEMGLNANDLQGCFELSNPVEVIRNQPEGGELVGGPFEFCVGDGEADMLEPGSITLSGNAGSNSQWVVTDDQGNILGLPPMPSVVNFDGAGPGTCLVWHLSYDGEITGLEMGLNANDLQGCFDLSNPVEVIRNQPEGGELVGGPFEFCVGDGIADMLEPGSIILSGNAGSNSQWVVTDDQGNILGLPPMPSAVNFDGAGPGTCLVWHLSYDGEITGLEMGMNANDLQGCFDLSNPVEVIRLTGSDCNPGLEGADLNLSISVDNALYSQYENVLYTVTITNDGPETATNITVAAGLPAGLVYTSHNTSAGDYNLFFETWTIPSLAPGASATLDLNLFTLVGGLEISNFVQVMTSDQDDPDSTPGNDTDQTPNEDDEAAVVISPFENGGVGGLPGTIDLELTIEADGETYEQFQNVVYTITLTNNGPDNASGIFVSAGLPEGMVYTSHNTSDGDYNLFFETWTVENLASGASATLELELFTLVNDVTITNFVQVFAADQNDSDSTPGNDTDQTPDEDDEAAVSINPSVGSIALSAVSETSTTERSNLSSAKLYPVPATAVITLELTSEHSTPATVNIVDLNGRLISSRLVELTKGFNQETFDITQLAQGMYLMTIVQQDGQRTTQRFTKAAY